MCSFSRLLSYSRGYRPCTPTICLRLPSRRQSEAARSRPAAGIVLILSGSRMYKGTSRYIQHRKRQGARELVTPGRKKGSRNQDLKRIRGAAQRGEVLIGSVKSVQSYGAFIALGSIEGLVHISEVADHRVADLTKILRPGMSVRVVVLQVDGDGKRIALSMRKVPQADLQQAVR